MANTIRGPFMNRTYFGDTRDLFKYDLVRHIMKALPAFDNFTFIPMLSDGTASKRTGNGAKKDLKKAVKSGKAGSQNKELLAHMERLQEIDDDLEYFQMIHAYFKNENILIDILHNRPFSNKARSEYFDDVLMHLPKKSLIFLDPDIGLAEKKPSEKHLLLEEVGAIFDRIDEKSILMIYQHFPREKHEEYIRRRCSDLQDVTGYNPVTITDNEVVFFFIVKNERLMSSLDGELARYANTYPMLSSSRCE